MKMFIGGSRSISELNAPVRLHLDDFMRRGVAVLIGDAPGADAAVQRYLADRQYAKVTVFAMDRCRNNAGGWPARHIEPRKDVSYYSAKDIVMAQEAQCGVMLWDGKSNGTRQNVVNLVGSGKRTLVYLASTKEFLVVASQRDFQTLLRSIGRRISEPSVGYGC
jgi:adenine-specific DNA-methyltransferase